MANDDRPYAVWIEAWPYANEVMPFSGHETYKGARKLANQIAGRFAGREIRVTYFGAISADDNETLFMVKSKHNY